MDVDKLSKNSAKYGDIMLNFAVCFLLGTFFILMCIVILIMVFWSLGW